MACRIVVVVDLSPGADDLCSALERKGYEVVRVAVPECSPNHRDVDAVDAAIRSAVEKREKERTNRLGSPPQAVADRQQELVGDSIVMRQVRSRIERLKGSDSTVLVTGEPGTGKDLVARILHDQGSRKGRPFVSVNCGELPGSDAVPTALGAGGTLFLDQVERLPIEDQAKLYRAIEHRGLRPLAESQNGLLDTRLIAASNIDLADEVSAGRFREVLFDRLSVVQIRLPALRERGLDTLLLAQHFVERFSAKSGKRVVGMTLGAARMLMAHDWPDNVRELRTWIETAVASARHDHITEAELLSNWAGGRRMYERSSNDDTLLSWNSLEARHIASILEEAGGNKARAARLLGMDRKTLYRKLERYGLDGADRHRRAH